MFLKGLVSRCFDIFHSKPSGLLTNRIKYLANGWVFLPVLCETAQASTLQIVVKKAGKQHAGYYTCGKVCIQVVWVELLTVKYSTVLSRSPDSKIQRRVDARKNSGKLRNVVTACQNWNHMRKYFNLKASEENSQDNLSWYCTKS